MKAKKVPVLSDGLVVPVSDIKAVSNTEGAKTAPSIDAGKLISASTASSGESFTNKEKRIPSKNNKQAKSSFEHAEDAELLDEKPSGQHVSGDWQLAQADPAAMSSTTPNSQAVAGSQPVIETSSTAKTWAAVQSTGWLLLSGVTLAAVTQNASTESKPQSQTVTGFLIDSPVQGVDYYLNGVYKGKTGADGSFVYAAGDKVSFKIGNITLAQDLIVKSDGKVFVQDLAGVDGPSSFRVERDIHNDRRRSF